MRYGGHHRPLQMRAASKDWVARMWANQFKDYGVHEAPNPSASILPADVRDHFDAVANAAREAYGGQAHMDAENTAWRWARQAFPYDGIGDQTAPERVEEVGTLVGLGKLIEYSWVTVDGDVYVRRFDERHLPDLWWNDETKTLYAFPKAKIPQACTLPVEELPDAAQMFERWAQREADCAKEVRIRPRKVKPQGMTDIIVYRSDKWHDKNPADGLRGSQEYVHTHGEGVWVWEDNQKDPGMIQIRGGQLDVEERGIVH